MKDLQTSINYWHLSDVKVGKNLLGCIQLLDVSIDVWIVNLIMTEFDVLY
jgi:hypothetical protein